MREIVVRQLIYWPECDADFMRSVYREGKTLLWRVEADGKRLRLIPNQDHPRAQDWLSQLDPLLSAPCPVRGESYHYVGVLAKGAGLDGFPWPVMSFGQVMKSDTVLVAHPRFYHPPAAVADVRWEDRIPQACYRAYQPTVVRKRICELSLLHPTLLDARLVRKEDKEWQKKYYDPKRVYLLEAGPVGEVPDELTDSYMSPEDQSHFKILIDYGGTDALLWKLLSGACVIRVAGEPRFWPDAFLKARKHYWRCSVEELPQTIEMLLKEDDLARSLARYGRGLATRYLTPSGAISHFHEVLRQTCALNG